MSWRRTATPLVLMLALAACTMFDGDPDAGDGDAPRVTAENLDPPIALPDFDGPDDLEQALTRFGECVEESFPIVLRYRTDPFLGMSTEISFRHRDEGELVEQRPIDA